MTLRRGVRDAGELVSAAVFYLERVPFARKCGRRGQRHGAAGTYSLGSTCSIRVRG